MKKTLIIAYGSQLTRFTTSSSDFDFAILAEKPLSLTMRTKISEHLSKKLKINEDKIDIIDLRTASPLLLYEVAKKGKLIEGDNFDFIRFKIRAWKVYQDTKKFRNLKEEMIKKYVKRLHT
ncbi:MAG: nucleotidyltransferase domain-containing protein [Candidatus Paceibacterota bacterium]|jgi:predicted nucleotidyltransferase